MDLENVTPDTIFQIVTKLKPDAWEIALRDAGILDESNDIPVGLRQGFYCGQRISRYPAHQSHTTIMYRKKMKNLLLQNMLKTLNLVDYHMVMSQIHFFPLLDTFALHLSQLSTKAATNAVSLLIIHTQKINIALTLRIYPVTLSRNTSLTLQRLLSTQS